MFGTIRVAAFFVILGIAVLVHAATPVCRTHASGPYCSYTGTIARAYVKQGGLILLYFDTEMDPSEPASVGISGVIHGAAAATMMLEDPEFAKLLYASILSAQARGAAVTVQMRGSVSGFLKIDRIWVDE